VAYLQERSLGAATFLPLEHLPVPTGPLPDQNGVSWVALSVGAPSLSLVHYLLGQVVIVDHLDQAEALWRLNGVVATYVTPAGEVLGPTGRLHGGGPAPAADVEHSLLARKRQVRELEEEVRRRSTVAGEAEATHEAQMARLREAIEAAQTRETELVAETTGCRVNLASTTERVEALGRELTRIDDIERDLTVRIDQARQRQTQLADRGAWLGEERERTDASAREVAVERDRMDAEVRR